MTITAPAASRQIAELVGSSAGAYISELQKGYLKDQSWAVATLAQLRRGAGKLPQEVPELWGVCGIERLYEERDLTEKEAVRAEAALFLAVTLYALHQQSQDSQGMHKDGVDLGEAVRRLMPDDGIDETIRRRFVRLGTATTRQALANRLREIVTLLRRDSIELDYALLARLLYLAQDPDGMRRVRERWGRAFHAYRRRTSPTETGADNAASPEKEAR
ncbi:type I-E CRISPR-associated protein Cse2/CasB [Nonomuraea sp. NPDC050478]|uniref:type I-E CRISPR-associated protein Cse2/CasB n=1 Tax=Nonomuraea sp. NPDC050478 TaxID=3364365 RepID=UPI00378D74FA